MWRVFGIPTPLPGALHTVASQHMTTLHNASGTHILCCQPAQVKYPSSRRTSCCRNCALFFRSRARSRVIAIRTAFVDASREFRRSIRTMCDGILLRPHATIESMCTPSRQTNQRVELRPGDDGIRRAVAETTGTTSTSEAATRLVVGGAATVDSRAGPFASGKTSSLVIPNILLAKGPVVSTSTKPDVMAATASARAAARDGHSSSIRAVKSNARAQSNASAGHR